MSTAKPRLVYGARLLKFLERRYEITESFDFRNCGNKDRDTTARLLLAALDNDWCNDVVPCHAGFGPLSNEFLLSPIGYCVNLGFRISEATAFTDYEIADLMQSESLNNAQCIAKTGLNLLQFFQKDRSGFYDLAADHCNRYLEKQICEQINEALPAYLEEQNDAMKQLTEYAA